MIKNLYNLLKLPTILKEESTINQKSNHKSKAYSKKDQEVKISNPFIMTF